MNDWRAVQASENEEKRKKAAQRLKAAYDTNVALLAKKRADFHARERANAERRKKQDEERAAADTRKKERAAGKAEKRKVRLGCPCRRTLLCCKSLADSVVFGDALLAACVSARLALMHDGRASPQIYAFVESVMSNAIAVFTDETVRAVHRRSREHVCSGACAPSAVLTGLRVRRLYTSRQ